jgi:ligand-binding sensor domain-containing protein/AraC-like DNA-binding protein
MKQNGCNQSFLFFITVSLVLFLLVSTFKLSALDPDKSIHQYVVDSWTIKNGLPANTVQDISQTPDGYLWLATTNGLVRFDGLRFTVFNTKNTPEITNNHITRLYVDREGILWFGAYYGDLAHIKNGKFKKFYLARNIGGIIIKSIYQDIHGKLWVGTFGQGLFFLEKDKIIQYKSPGELSINKSIASLYEDSKGNLWTGTLDGLYLLRNGMLEKKKLKIINQSFNVFSIFEDCESNLWIGTNLGLIQIKENKHFLLSKKDGLRNDYITAILEDVHRNIWVGTSSGIIRLKKRKPDFFNIEDFFEDSVIACIFEDRENSIWIGTYGSGLKRLREGLFTTYTSKEGLQNDYITCVFEDKKRNIWIGTAVGLNRISKGVVKVPSIKDVGINRLVNCICESHNGSIWVGTNGYGLFSIEDGKIKNLKEKDGLVNNNISALCIDSRNNLWIGTNSGLSSYKNGKFSTYTAKDGLMSTTIFNIYEDKNMNLWLGTLGGIYWYKNGRFVFFRTRNGVPRTTAFTIYEETEDVLWIGTFGLGLYRYKNNNICSITAKDGLIGNSIFQIVEDHQNNFWICSEKGIFSVNKSELIDFCDGKRDKIHSIKYGNSEGLKDIDGSRYSLLKASDGKLWLGTAKGLSVIDPGKSKINKVPPPVIIEKVKTDEKIIFRYDRNTIFKNQNSIVFFFTANTFISPEKILFKHKLEGFDKNWVELNTDYPRLAKYKDLPPGKYRFRIIACNSDGIWNKKGDSFDFVIYQSFFHTFIFKIICVFVFFILCFYIYYFYKKSSILKSKKRKKLTLNPEKIEEYIDKLLYLLEREKIYRDENLTLKLLASKISIHPQTLSQIINEQMKKNFNDFINSYRLKEAKKRLMNSNESHHSILGIAFDIGFNSKTSFNRVFKKHIKMTPSEFRKKFKKESPKERK